LNVAGGGVPRRRNGWSPLGAVVSALAREPIVQMAAPPVCAARSGIEILPVQIGGEPAAPGLPAPASMIRDRAWRSRGSRSSTGAPIAIGGAKLSWQRRRVSQLPHAIAQTGMTGAAGLDGTNPGTGAGEGVAASLTQAPFTKRKNATEPSSVRNVITGPALPAAAVGSAAAPPPMTRHFTVPRGKSRRPPNRAFGR
jgi:hypothetical protein